MEVSRANAMAVRHTVMPLRLHPAGRYLGLLPPGSVCWRYPLKTETLKMVHRTSLVSFQTIEMYAASQTIVPSEICQ